MINPNFNKDLMREKVRRNLLLGFTITEIKRLLIEEQLDGAKQILQIQCRNIELQDQIEFMNEEYVSQSDKISSPAP